MSWQPLSKSVPLRNGQSVALPEGWSQWANDKYVVLRRVIKAKDDSTGDMIHLSIRRQDRRPAKDWRDFQRIKNQLAGPDYEGVELYPRESRKVDTANQYHLWCFPFTLGFGLGDERMVTDNHVSQAGEPGAEQRDNEPADGPLNTVEEMLDWLERQRYEP